MTGRKKGGRGGAAPAEELNFLAPVPPEFVGNTGLLTVDGYEEQELYDAGLLMQPGTHRLPFAVSALTVVEPSPGIDAGILSTIVSTLGTTGMKSQGFTVQGGIFNCSFTKADQSGLSEDLLIIPATAAFEASVFQVEKTEGLTTPVETVAAICRSNTPCISLALPSPILLAPKVCMIVQGVFLGPLDSYSSPAYANMAYAHGVLEVVWRDVTQQQAQAALTGLLLDGGA